MDDQVKLHGYRIELSEIEHVYEKEDFIAKAVALVRNDRLVLYVQSQGDTIITKEMLERAKMNAKRQLNHYMIPS